jgi:hypothetical protein
MRKFSEPPTLGMGTVFLTQDQKGFYASILKVLASLDLSSIMDELAAHEWFPHYNLSPFLTLHKIQTTYFSVNRGTWMSKGFKAR